MSEAMIADGVQNQVVAQIVEPFEIDAEIESWLPPLSADARIWLKQQIRQHGNCDPFTVAIVEGKRLLADGYQRRSIILELLAEGAVVIYPPAIREMEFADKLAVLDWMTKNQMGRRNMTAVQRAMQVLRQEHLVARLQQAAFERMKAGKAQTEGTAVGAEPASGETNEILAKMAGVGRKTIETVRNAMKSDNPTVKKLLAGTFVRNKDKEQVKDVSAYELAKQLEQVKRVNATKERQTQAAKVRPIVGLQSNSLINAVHNCDALKLLGQMADGQVTLTFTSPPYYVGQMAYENYVAPKTYEEWLDRLKAVFREVFRVTRSGGRCVINCDATKDVVADVNGKTVRHFRPVLADVTNMMLQIGWKPGPERCWYKQNCCGKNPTLGSWALCSAPAVLRNHEYLLTFYKDEWQLDGDVQKCDLRDDEYRTWLPSHWYIQPETRKAIRDTHPCAFPEELAFRMTKLNSYVGDLVLDPFAGSGTVPFVAAALGRNFVGSDSGTSYVELARKRIAALDGRSPEERENLINRFFVPDGSRVDGYADATKARCKVVLEDDAGTNERKAA